MRRTRLRRWRERLDRPGVLLAILAPLVLLATVDLVADPILERRIVGTVNERLKGYTATLRGVDFNPVNFALEIDDLRIVQDAHPAEPVARFPRLGFNVHWTALLFGRVVADSEVERPTLRINRIQLEEELRDEVDLEQRGWQQALEALYPLEINRLELEGGRLSYIDDDPSRPLELSEARIVARNLRNVISPDRTYPSQLHFTSRLFDTGRVIIDGHADALAEPFPGVLAEIALDDVPLERLRTVSAGSPLEIAGGRLNARGRIEWHPSRRELHLADATLTDLRADYVQDPARERMAREAAERLEQVPASALRVDHLAIVGGELGYVNLAADPPWRVFVSDAGVTLRDYTNFDPALPARFHAHGRFMDSGEARAGAVFRSDEQGPDFDLAVAIEATELARLNDLLRATVGLDVAGGTLSVYSDLHVANGRISGYVKPLFREPDIYDSKQDARDNPFRQLYELLAEGIADLLENRKRDEVATVAELSGTLDDPRTRNLEVVLRLIRNAFVRAILPGFERELDRGPDGTARLRRSARKERERSSS